MMFAKVFKIAHKLTVQLPCNVPKDVMMCLVRRIHVVCKLYLGKHRSAVGHGLRVTEPILWYTQKKEEEICQSGYDLLWNWEGKSPTVLDKAMAKGESGYICGFMR